MRIALKYIIARNIEGEKEGSWAIRIAMDSENQTLDS